MTIHNEPQRAMILAAGRGTRMRHLSDSVPKPMLTVGGTSILKRLLSKMKESAVTNVVINLWYKGDLIQDHVKTIQDPVIDFSHEDELLETGGGTKKALPLLGDEPFFVLNGDMLWEDGSVPMLDRLRQTWDSQKMDILLLLHAADNVPGYSGKGDYFINDKGNLERNVDLEKEAPYVFAGARICHPRIFDGEARTRFGFLDLFDKAEKESRLYGLVHDGSWFHLSTPEMLQATEAIFLNHRENKKQNHG